MFAGEMASSSYKHFEHGGATRKIQESRKRPIRYRICGKFIQVLPIIRETAEDLTDGPGTDVLHNTGKAVPRRRNVDKTIEFEAAPTTSNRLSFSRGLETITTDDITRASSSRRMTASFMKYMFPDDHGSSDVRNVQSFNIYRHSSIRNMQLDSPSITHQAQLNYTTPKSTYTASSRHNDFSPSRRYPIENLYYRQTMKSTLNTHRPVTEFEGIKRTVDYVPSIVCKGNNYPMLDTDYRIMKILKTTSIGINEASNTKSETAGTSSSYKREISRDEFFSACHFLKTNYPYYFAHLRCLYGIPQITRDEATCDNFEEIVTEGTAAEIIHASRRPIYILNALEDRYRKLRNFHRE